MHRRAFIGSTAGAIAGVAAAGKVTVLDAAGPTAQQPHRAIATLRAAKRNEVEGNIDRLRAAYHSDAMVIDPGVITPVVGRAGIVETMRKNSEQRKLLYFYYRQPQVLEMRNAALVVSNYEAGYTEDGKTVEDSGKSTSVVLLGATPPLIALEVLIPNLYSGGYGSLGSGVARNRFGIFPLRALGQPGESARLAGGGENEVLYALVGRINDAFVSGDTAEVLKYSNTSGIFLVGDYSPFYIAGADDVKEHLADFYRTSKVNAVRSSNPVVRIWGGTAAVAFDFDIDYLVNGQNRRSPGRAVYTFAQRGAPGARWAMATCGTSHLVFRNIGDPYPQPAG